MERKRDDNTSFLSEILDPIWYVWIVNIILKNNLQTVFIYQTIRKEFVLSNKLVCDTN